MARIPFQERKTRLRGVLDLATGAYPAFLFGGQLGRCVPVFHFHDVTQEYLEPYFRHLSENGYHTVTSEVLGRCVRDGDLPDERAVALCFDDAWASLVLVVAPLLKQYGLSAITYVVPGRVGQEPGGRLASWQELEQVRDGGVIDIQAHTYSHAMIFCDEAIEGFVQPDRMMTYLSRPLLETGESLRFLSPDMLGAPLYTCRSRMSDAHGYQADPEMRHACMKHVRENGGEAFFRKPGWREVLMEVAADRKGRFETENEQKDAIRGELVRAREVLTERLGLATVRQVCMPWGICGQLAEDMVREAGYETAVADRLYGRRFVTGKQNPYRIMRLKHQHIMRLPVR